MGKYDYLHSSIYGWLLGHCLTQESKNAIFTEELRAMAFLNKH